MNPRVAAAFEVSARIDYILAAAPGPRRVGHREGLRRRQTEHARDLQMREAAEVAPLDRLPAHRR